MPLTGLPIREFICKKCGKRVFVRDKRDHRESFCSRECERVYWKCDYLYAKQGMSHGYQDNRGMSGGMSLGSLIRRERRVLD